MKKEVQECNRTYLYHALCVLVGAAALIPAGCNYIMDGGIVAEWIARVQELAGRGLCLFPSAETIAETGIKVNGMNSNLWFWASGIIYRLTGNMALAHRIYMLAVQAGTLAAALLMFRRIFAGKKLPVFFGLLLYMTCPYRIYVCYDLANLSQAAAWMLLPLYVWGIMGVMGGGGKLHNVAAAAFALAGMGYADVVFFIAAAGITLAASAVFKKFSAFAAVAAGGIIFLPGLHRLAQYLFRDGFMELEMPLHSIMGEGYRLGEYFSSYAFRGGHPGMGLGMMLCLLAGMWLGFVKKDGEKRRVCCVFAVISALLAVLSFYCFPWDLFQRMGGWSLKLVSLADTPAVFWGMACFGFCVPAAGAAERISRYEDRQAAYALPIMAALACLGVCIYQCSMLICNRPPLM